MNKFKLNEFILLSLCPPDHASPTLVLWVNKQFCHCYCVWNQGQWCEWEAGNVVLDSYMDVIFCHLAFIVSIFTSRDCLWSLEIVVCLNNYTFLICHLAKVSFLTRAWTSDQRVWMRFLSPFPFYYYFFSFKKLLFVRSANVVLLIQHPSNLQ